MGLFSGIANIVGGVVGARAANKSADRLANALTTAGQTLEGGAKEFESRVKPIADVSPQVIQRLQDILLKGDLSGFYESPDYQYRMKSGLDALQAGAAGSKMLMSGKTLKALEKYRQEQATQEFGNVLNRLGTLFGLTSPYYQTYAGLPYTMAADKAGIVTNIGQVMSQGIQGKAAGMQQGIKGVGDVLRSIGSVGGFGKTGQRLAFQDMLFNQNSDNAGQGFTNVGGGFF